MVLLEAGLQRQDKQESGLLHRIWKYELFEILPRALFRGIDRGVYLTSGYARKAVSSLDVKHKLREAVTRLR